MEPAIDVQGLRKAYGALEAVRGISFEVARGEVFAILGPNGAGKTTTVEILEGYRDADGGTIRVLGMDPATGGSAYRARIGIVLQASGVYPYMSVREAAELFAGWYPNPRPVADVLDAVDLGEQARRRVRHAVGRAARAGSTWRSRWSATRSCCSSTSRPPASTRAPARGAWEMIAGLAAAGTTILLTTHYMDEAQALADRVAVMRAGEIVALGPPSSLGAGGRPQIRFELPDGADPHELARAGRRRGARRRRPARARGRRPDRAAARA